MAEMWLGFCFFYKLIERYRGESGGLLGGGVISEWLIEEVRF